MSRGATPVQAPAELTANYVNRRAFLEAVRVGPSACRFFVGSALALPPGAPVRVRVAFTGEVEQFFVLGTVVRSREAIHPSVRTGVVVEVTGPALPGFSRLYAWASRRPEHWGRRGNERVPVEVAVSWAVGARAGAGVARDLSRGGLWVTTDGPRPPPESVVRLQVRTGWLRTAAFVGRVAWSGHFPGKSGFGVEFVECGLDGQSWLAKVLGEPKP